MANLFWKRARQVKALLATQFKTEEEFEKTVFDTPEILEDIFLLKRQIRGGNKTGIPDIIGVEYHQRGGETLVHQPLDGGQRNRKVLGFHDSGECP
jgi:hypothetical protein